MTVVSCNVSTLQKRFVFATGWPDASGDMGRLDYMQTVGDNAMCIDHIQHTEAEVIVEEVSASEVDDALLITVMMQMQPFRNYLLDDIGDISDSEQRNENGTCHKGYERCFYEMSTSNIGTSS